MADSDPVGSGVNSCGGAADVSSTFDGKPLDAPADDMKLGHLVVRVVDYYDGKLIPDVMVEVDELGGMTSTSGIADFGKVAPGIYHVSAEKEGYRPAPKKDTGPAFGEGEVVAGGETEIDLKLVFLHRENIAFIGSEMDYEKFWTKMMFISAAFFDLGSGTDFRQAAVKTIAYVDVGYVKAEKLALDYLRGKFGCKILKLGGSGDLVNYLNDRPHIIASGVRGKLLLQDVAFFSHGLPSVISLNYDSSPEVDFSKTEVSSTSSDVFVTDGCIYSYACRTGVSSSKGSFLSDDAAGPKDSLAQMMADHFCVDVYAFLTRSDYDGVLREKSDSSRIAGVLKSARTTREGKLISIPPEHEALPHHGLGDTWGGGPAKEGTIHYALWRKQGGRQLPVSAPTPTGLTPGLHKFTKA